MGRGQGRAVILSADERVPPLGTPSVGRPAPPPVFWAARRPAGRSRWRFSSLPLSLLMAALSFRADLSGTLLAAVRRRRSSTTASSSRHAELPAPLGLLADGPGDRGRGHDPRLPARLLPRLPRRPPGGALPDPPARCPSGRATCCGSWPGSSCSARRASSTLPDLGLGVIDRADRRPCSTTAAPSS